MRSTLCGTRVCGAAASGKHCLSDWAQTQNITCLTSQCTNQVLRVRTTNICTCQLHVHVDPTLVYYWGSGCSCAASQNILLSCPDMLQRGDGGFAIFFCLLLASLTNSVDLPFKVSMMWIVSVMKLIWGSLEKDGLISHSKNKEIQYVQVNIQYM